MYRDFKIKPPFFEIGPKAYLYGEEVLSLAKQADALQKIYLQHLTHSIRIFPWLSKKQRISLIFAQQGLLPIGRYRFRSFLKW